MTPSNKTFGRVILVGVDGATWRVLAPWAKAGKLPAFKRMMAAGAFGPLESTLPPNSPPAWTSIFTGSNPGRHGIFGFVKRKEGSYFVTPISSRDRKVPPIWGTLTEAGKGCVLLNIPFSYPPDHVKGLMTTGLGTPSKGSEFVHPKGRRKDILGQFPDYDVDYSEDTIELGAEKDPLGQIHRITKAQVGLAKHLFTSEDWDLFSVVFRSVDVVQHYYWKKKAAVLGAYRQIDAFLDWILDHMDKKDVLLICSDHGFGPVRKCFNVNNWLESIDLFHISTAQRKRAKPRLSAEKVQTLLLRLGLRDLVWKLKRSDLLEPVLRGLVRSENASYMFDIEWQRTKAYLVEGSLGLVNLNLRGREPRGIVRPKEKETVLRKLEQEASKLKDPSTDSKVIERIYRGDDVFKGGSAEAPDLVLVPAEGYRLVGKYDPGRRLFGKETLRFGEHERYGVFLACGAGVRRGHAFDKASVLDLTPTMLYVLGLPGGPHIDGRVLMDIFEDDFKKGRRTDLPRDGARRRTLAEMERIKRAVGRIR